MIRYHGRFTSGKNETDTLKFRNIGKIMVDRFYDTFYLTFHRSCIHIKMQNHRCSSIIEANEGRVREGKNTLKKIK